MCKPTVTWSIKAIIFWLLIYGIFSSYVLSKISLHTILYLKQTFSFSIDNHSMSFLKTFFYIFVETCMTLFLVCFILKRKQVSFRDIGIQLEIRFRTCSGLIISGALFNTIVFLFFNYYEMITVTPASQTIEQSYWPFTLGVSLITLGLLTPFNEEVIFRGILFQSLRNQMSVIPAIAISALIFGMMHVDSINSWVHFATVILMGCITCIIFFRTGSLTNACIFHASGNSTGIVLAYIFYVWN